MVTALFVGFLAFILGNMVIGRVMMWIFILVQAFRSTPSRLTLSLFLLHSGPWLLALAIGAVWLAASQAGHPYLWPMLAGLAISATFIGSMSWNMWKRRPSVDAEPLTALVPTSSKPLEPEPLTPEGLYEMKRRFIRTTSLWMGIPITVLQIFFLWGINPIVFVLLILWGLVGSYGFAWFMWQWESARLLADEENRLKRLKANN